MEYKVELLGHNKLLLEDIYKNLSHPNQTVRKAITALPKNNSYKFFTIFIINTRGEVWVYGIEKVGKKYKGFPVDHDFVHKGDAMKAFSGIKSVRSMV